MADVIMPQMGESIAEGTVTKWLKNVGDRVERDEPLFEISTDKVDAEIPSPAAGVLKEIRVVPGTTVAIHTVVGVIAAVGEGAAAPVLDALAPPPPAAPPTEPQAAAAPAAADPADPAAVEPVTSAVAFQIEGETQAPAPPPLPAPEKPRAEMTAEELRLTRSSPVVRKIAAEHQVDIRSVSGTGIGGRVTKQDILGHIETRPDSPAPADAAQAAATAEPVAQADATAEPVAPAAATAEPVAPAAATAEPVAPAAAPAPPSPAFAPAPPPLPPAPAVAPTPTPAPPPPAPAPPATPDAAPPAPAPAPPAVPAPAARLSATTPAAAPAPAPAPGGIRVEVVPMSPIRRKTAEHMVLSKRTSAHVSTVFEVDMTRIGQLREKHKAAFEGRGVRLTYTPFILKAVVDALKAFPVVNASIDGENVLYHKDVNLAVAVALDWGLIVPVIHHADEKNVLGLARAVNDLADRARAKKLKVEEVQGGTFTVTNPGVFGSLFGTPIINQPQVAILGIGTIEKRPVVREDAIAIRTMCYFALTFDHRLVDGADADRFMAHVKASLQDFDEAGM